MKECWLRSTNGRRIQPYRMTTQTAARKGDTIQDRKMGTIPLM